MIQRRDLLAGAAATGALSLLPLDLHGTSRAADDGWNAGLVAHLLPTVSHDRILLKASFHEPLKEIPFLHVGGRPIVGERTDREGFFWQFDAAGLEPSRPYALVLTDARGRPLCDEWPLATFPATDDQPKQLRLLIFTCAGGHDGLGKHLPVSTRVRLLRRGLSFRPDAIIANGDHVYWDLRTRRGNQSGSSAEAAVIAGRFDRTAPVLGSPNEAVLKKAVGPQIVPLYAALCRSTPVFFMQDDHDYFENDEADDRFISFPPDAFMMAAGRASQHLYYPEFLPDPMRPLGLASASAADRPHLIGQAAQQPDPDPLSRAALELMVSILGTEAGNLALKVLSTGGLYLAGGIPQRILPILEDGRFMRPFVAKGRLGEMLARMPVHVVTLRAALLGAALSGLEISAPSAVIARGR